ncbi:MAG: hypothetical protein R3275_04135 [Saprospiraceae bacterium]|nr:hypothetical protein [Saprospiraceae bacterium]
MIRLSRIISVVLLLCSFVDRTLAQDESNIDDLAAVMINFDFGVQLPGGDLADVFGFNNTIAAGIEYRFSDSPLSIRLGVDYLFGRTVKKDVLNELRTRQGYLIGTDGLPADVFLRERGVNGHFGLTWNQNLVKGANRFELVASAGGSYLIHWIRIQDDRQSADQIRGEYKKGYDRRRAGFGLHQFIGIRYLSNDRRINFIAGFDLTQAWTKSVRPYNFDTMEADNTTNMDLLHGFRIGWIIPFYFNQSTENIYY